MCTHENVKDIIQVVAYQKHFLILDSLYVCFCCSTSVLFDPTRHALQKSFSARAVSRSHQRAEHILKNLQQEEEKRRLGREASIITAIPVSQEACYEPTCSPPPEQEEEGGPIMQIKGMNRIFQIHIVL